MGKIKNKFDAVLDALYGNKVKGRWIKVLATVAVILLFIWLMANLGYDKEKGFYLKPWDVKVQIQKGAPTPQ